MNTTYQLPIPKTFDQWKEQMDLVHDHLYGKLDDHEILAWAEKGGISDYAGGLLGLGIVSALFYRLPSALPVSEPFFRLFFDLSHNMADFYLLNAGIGNESVCIFDAAAYIAAHASLGIITKREACRLIKQLLDMEEEEDPSDEVFFFIASDEEESDLEEEELSDLEDSEEDGSDNEKDE